MHEQPRRSENRVDRPKISKIATALTLLASYGYFYPTPLHIYGVEFLKRCLARALLPDLP